MPLHAVEVGSGPGAAGDAGQAAAPAVVPGPGPGRDQQLAPVVLSGRRVR